MQESEIARGLEKMFENVGEDEGMWKVASKFAAQFDELQILGLTKLTYIANICSDPIKNRLISFRDHYISLCNNKDTAMFMLRMNEMSALKQYMTAIEGKVNVNK